jgi:hypothetical protein
MPKPSGDIIDTMNTVEPGFVDWWIVWYSEQNADFQFGIPRTIWSSILTPRQPILCDLLFSFRFLYNMLIFYVGGMHWTKNFQSKNENNGF